MDGRPRSHEGIQWIQISERSSRAALAWKVENALHQQEWAHLHHTSSYTLYSFYIILYICLIYVHVCICLFCFLVRKQKEKRITFPRGHHFSRPVRMHQPSCQQAFLQVWCWSSLAELDTATGAVKTCKHPLSIGTAYELHFGIKGGYGKSPCHLSIIQVYASNLCVQTDVPLPSPITGGLSQTYIRPWPTAQKVAQRQISSSTAGMKRTWTHDDAWKICPEAFTIKYIIWFVVWTPLKNMKVNWDDEIPNIWENEKCSKLPTSNSLNLLCIVA